MKFTLMVEDRSVGIDGLFKNFTITGIAENIRAVQFNGSTGHIEFNDGTPNESITDLSAFQGLISAWEAIPDVTDIGAIEATQHLTAIKAQEAKYPVISKEVADTILSNSWKNLNVTYHFRRSDNNIIGIYVASAKGFEAGTGAAALLALRSLVELCKTTGIPFFADLQPTAGVTLEDFTVFFEGIGCAAIRSSSTNFVYTPWDFSFAKASRLTAIKAKRDYLTINGGHKIGDYWYHSNEISLIQQLALNGLANQLSTGGAADSTPIIPTPWKTLGGEYVTLTVGIAKGFVSSALTQQSALFNAAKNKMDEVNALTTIEAVNAYDVKAGFPEVYQPV